MKKLFYVLLIAFAAQLTIAQEFNREKLDQYFDVLEENDQFMGSVALMKNGEIIYTNAIGYADVETKQGVDTETKYRVGSISKTFTAVLVMQAIESGKLDLSTKLSKFYPQIKHSKKITISNLLNHRTGIHNFTDDESYISWNTTEKSKKELLNIIQAGGSDFKPNKKFSYSNSNYLLLSFILEDIYNKPFATLLDEQIIDKLKLEHTYYGGKINTANNEVHSYTYKGNWSKSTETDMSVPIGAGAVVSTPSDLTRFANSLFNGELVSKDSLAKMKTLEDGFGYGLFTMPFNDKISYGHTGGIDNFVSVYTYFGDEGVAVALSSNGTRINTNDILINLLSATFGQPFEIPSFNTVKLTNETLDLYSGVYSGEGFPFKITISNTNGTLIAQAEGQPEISLDATSDKVFENRTYGVTLTFNVNDHTMTLNQAGQEAVLTRE